MSIRIAIPEPTSSDPAYNSRSLPPYIASLQSAGTTPVVVPLHERPDRVAKLLSTVQAVLLPGSGFDVDPQIYGEARIDACGPQDAARNAVDELLLQDAFNLHKPILAICYGVQSLNVWRNGSLIQDLRQQGETVVNHAPGRHINEAHPVDVAPQSRLAALLKEQGARISVNSSHHQALKVAGDNLLVTGRSPEDGVIEAVELDSPDHWVVGVQWHPERTYTVNGFSRALFGAFAHAAEVWRPREVHDSALSV
jgi:putative glutamine amidotransferase